MKKERLEKMTEGFDRSILYYLASPYSKYPYGINEAFEDISEIAGTLLKKGIFVYSPIAHSHPVAKYGKIDPYDHSVWMPLDLKIAESCKGLIVAKMLGWEDSYGVSLEIKHFKELNLPIYYMDVTNDELI